MILYKYCPVRFAKNILTELRVKVTPPNQFNDPFELTPCSRYMLTPEIMQQMAKDDPQSFYPNWEKMRKRGFQLSFEQTIEMLQRSVVTAEQVDGMKKLMLPNLVQLDLSEVDRASEYVGILCLTEPKDSIPMWAYYADTHKGIVYGIDANHRCLQLENPDHFDVVKYRVERLKTNPHVKVGTPEWYRQIRNLMFRKSDKWIQENEHRRIYQLSTVSHREIDGKQLYFIYIDPKVIREVIFGYNVDKTVEQDIRNEIKRYSYLRHIKLFRCKRHGKLYKFNIVPADEKASPGEGEALA